VEGLITAQKDPFWDMVLYHGYLRWSLRRSFHAIHARGLEHLQELPASAPVIACANHSNWWDGLAVFFLTRFQPRKAFYCMMEEAQLKHYRFFTWLGAFSVDPTNSLRAAAAVRYSLNLLKQPRTMLWIFPQGRQAPAGEPVSVRAGASFLCARVPHAQVLPVAFRYVFLREQRPEMLIGIGAPMPALEVNDARIEAALRTLCAELDEAVRAEDVSGFQYLMRPGLSVNKWWEGLVRLLRFDFRGFEAKN
jgi:1-acyl-sn-glycerol-3-phosphate acyltransferase